MHRASEEGAAVMRAQWMAQLAAAIDGAQRVAWQLAASQHTSIEARELYSQLENARLELEALRGVTAQLRQELEPWLAERLGWSGTLEQPSD